MKLIVKTLGLLLCQTLLGGLSLAAEADPEARSALRGRCVFEGVYASGCIEFWDGGWSAASMQQYCQEKSKPGAAASLEAGACTKNAYNARCSSMQGGGLADIYVNNMPSFICSRYMRGSLARRPGGGW